MVTWNKVYKKTHLVPNTDGAPALPSSLAGVLPEDEEAVEDVFSLLGLVGVDLVGLLCS